MLPESCLESILRLTAADSIVKPVSFAHTSQPRAYALGFILSPLRGWPRGLVRFDQLEQHSTRTGGMHKHVTMPARPDLDFV
jgi:hypothetical protein